MATQTFTVLPLANRTGTIQSPSVDWPINVKSATFRVSSTTYTDPATGIDITVEESLDGGTSWHLMANALGSVGGGTAKGGGPLLPSLTISLGDQELSTPRKVRGRLDITGTVRFALLVDILS
jgi:hypothetical protein